MPCTIYYVLTWTVFFKNSNSIGANYTFHLSMMNKINTSNILKQIYSTIFFSQLLHDNVKNQILDRNSTGKGVIYIFMI